MLPALNPVKVGPLTVGDGSLTVIAGPCLAESEELCLHVGQVMAEVCEELALPYIFKASFDKANRTSGVAPRGTGIQEGMRILESVRQKLGLPITTDIHLPDQAMMVDQFVDLLQIPAFLSRQSDLLQAAADTGLPVNVKKGQFLAPWDAKNIVDKLRGFGAKGIILTERGTTFGYNTLVVDMPGLETMRSFGVPVCFDATHSAQRPGGAGEASGGNRETIPALSRGAAAVGVDAIFVEVHPDPSRALSDATTQWPLDQAKSLLKSVKAVWLAGQQS